MVHTSNNITIRLTSSMFSLIMYTPQQSFLYPKALALTGLGTKILKEPRVWALRLWACHPCFPGPSKGSVKQFQAQEPISIVACDP